MGFADSYLGKQKNFQIQIEDLPHPELKFIVVIPCFNEPDLLKTFQSLKNCQAIKSAIEVITVINSAEDTEKEIVEQNITTYMEAKHWISQNEHDLFRYHLIHVKNLPSKFAGAGMARKIGMDEAVARFNKLEQENGVILSMDADTTVDTGYFVELEKHFEKFPQTNAATIYFEHPTKGNEFNQTVYNAVRIYELHMRYYKKALEFIGFPYAFYTVGSCFAVNVRSYVKQGGMNRKKAGEDFYFLHKVFPLGNCHELSTTAVYPSPRISDRVPFGTGPMIQSIIDSGDKEFLTYRFAAFKELKILFSIYERFFRAQDADIDQILTNLPDCLTEFLVTSNVKSAVQEINQNSSQLPSFKKRFFNWFDAFRILKFLNFAHEAFYPKGELFNEANELYHLITNKMLKDNTCKMLLEEYRILDKQF